MPEQALLPSRSLQQRLALLLLVWRVAGDLWRPGSWAASPRTAAMTSASRCCQRSPWQQERGHATRTVNITSRSKTAAAAPSRSGHSLKGLQV
jgi:hypothetical protein